MQQENEQDLPIKYTPIEDKPLLEPKNESETINFSPLFLGCPKPIKNSWFVIMAIFIGVYFVTTLFIGNILLLPMQVDGSSMYPTLNVEYATTSNAYAQDVVYLWRTNKVVSNDIIVFKAKPYDNSIKNQNGTIYYIKRVIATSGDTIQFKRVTEPNESYIAEYVVYKNGEKLNEPYILNKMLYNTLNEKFASIVNEEKFVVPADAIFVMGDNRNNSKDSRELGFISLNDVVGKVVLHIPYGKTIFYGIYQSIKQGYLF